MKIVKANLCLRFYPADGWTRGDVCNLLREDQRLARVMPRYYDWRDPKGRALDDGLPHDECDYFAVYDLSDPFDPEKLKEHEIV